jgi:ESSS subunit of NADH:ubiquinone oxidoreductase (complex I)
LQFSQKQNGPLRESNPGPPAPEAGIMPLDQVDVIIYGILTIYKRVFWVFTFRNDCSSFQQQLVTMLSSRVGINSRCLSQRLRCCSNNTETLLSRRRLMKHENRFDVHVTQPQQQQSNGFVVRQFGSGGGVPVPQSATAELFAGHPKKEGWEWTIGWWYPSSFILICLVLGTTPETSIQSWAREEASARLALKEKGFTDFQFGVHYSNLTEEQMKSAWDKLSNKTTRMNDEDDDEEEEDEEAEDEGDNEDEEEEDDE